VDTHRLQSLALQDLTDDELDELLTLIATERERRWKLRRRPGLVEEWRRPVKVPGSDASEGGSLAVGDDGGGRLVTGGATKRRRPSCGYS
jgi:hypothetical protein